MDEQQPKTPMELPSEPRKPGPIHHVMEHVPSRTKDVDIGDFSTLEDARTGLNIVAQLYNQRPKAGDKRYYVVESLDDGKAFEAWNEGKTELQLRLYITARGA